MAKPVSYEVRVQGRKVLVSNRTKVRRKVTLCKDLHDDAGCEPLGYKDVPPNATREFILPALGQNYSVAIAHQNGELNYDIRYERGRWVCE